jgi:hypothetical protein
VETRPEPLPPAVPGKTEFVPLPQSRQPTPKTRRSRRWLSCGCLGLPGGLLLLLALFFLTDPLKIHLWGRLSGSYDAAAEVMPADTSLYLGINALAALPAEIQWVTESFSAAPSPGIPLASQPSGLAAPSLHPPQQIAIPGDLLGQIQRSTGIRIPDDLYPFVGQYAGVGFMTTQAGESWFIAIETRPFGKADEFLQDLQRNLSDIQEMSFTTQTVSGVSITVQDVPENRQRIAFCNTGRLVLIASNLEAIRQMLSAQGARSLAQDAVYRQLVEQRQADWSFSLYLGRAQAENSEMTSQLFEEIEDLLGSDTIETWNGSLLSGAIVSAGLRVDAFHALTPSSLPEPASQVLESLDTGNAMLARVPAQAYLYTAGPRFDLAYAALLDTSLFNSSSRRQLMDQLDVAFGFNPEAELINHLDGAWVLFLASDDEGFVPYTTDLPVAVTLLAEASNMPDLQDGLGQLTELITESGGELEERNDGETLRIELADPFETTRAPAAIYGMNREMFFFGTDPVWLEEALSETSPLLEAARYRQLSRSLPGSTSPVLYVDLDPFYDLLRSNMSERSRELFDESIAPFQAVQEVLVAFSLPQPDVLRSTILLGLPPR